MHHFLEQEIQDYDDLGDFTEQPYDQGEGDHGLDFDEAAAISEHFVTKDYTLDSPLLSGEIDAFILYWNGSDYDEVNRRTMWDHRRTWLSKNGVAGSTVHGSDIFHKWCGRFNRDDPDVTEFHQFLAIVDRDARHTFAYVEAFYQGWIDKRLDFVDRSGLDIRTLRCGSRYYLLYKIVLFLNSSSEHETLNLIGTFGGLLCPGFAATTINRPEV